MLVNIDYMLCNHGDFSIAYALIPPLTSLIPGIQFRTTVPVKRVRLPGTCGPLVHGACTAFRTGVSKTEWTYMYYGHVVHLLVHQHAILLRLVHLRGFLLLSTPYLKLLFQLSLASFLESLTNLFINMRVNRSKQSFQLSLL